MSVASESVSSYVAFTFKFEFKLFELMLLEGVEDEPVKEEDPASA